MGGSFCNSQYVVQLAYIKVFTRILVGVNNRTMECFSLDDWHLTPIFFPFFGESIHAHYFVL